LKSSEVSGFAAEMVCKRKHSKYSSIISSNYVFKGLAFETLGQWRLLNGGRGGRVKLVKLIPPVNFCSDENIQTIFGTKLKDFLNYRIDYNSIS
jgi:hypothetical protein